MLFAPPNSYTLIANAVSVGVGSSFDIIGLASYRDILLTFKDWSFTGAGTPYPTIAPSCDNGSTFGTARGLNTAVTGNSNDLFAGHVELQCVSDNLCVISGAIFTGAGYTGTPSNGAYTGNAINFSYTTANAKINALRMAFNGAQTFDGGTYNLYGIK